MSKHHKSEYYVKANGTHVMSYEVFKAMDHDKVCKILKIRGN